MAAGTESLNAAVAASIIMWKLRKRGKMILRAIWFSELGMERQRKCDPKSLRVNRNLYTASESDYRVSGIISRQDIEKLKNKSLNSAERIVEECSIKRIRILSIEDDDYPVRLANADDAPIVLYYKGNLPTFDTELAIAVVGPRKIQRMVNSC